MAFQNITDIHRREIDSCERMRVVFSSTAKAEATKVRNLEYKL